MFSEKHPIAWSFHRNTGRWQRNIPPIPANKPEELPLYKEYENVPIIYLPEVNLPEMPLSEAIQKRFSCRDYEDVALKLSDIATILKGGYGLKRVSFFENAEYFERMVPSGGGMYPLELYLFVNNIENVPQGIYHYAIYPPVLEQLYELKFSKFYITRLFMNQGYVAESSVILIATSCLERNMRKYGDRGYRYILYEAGHVFQNINLVASASGLGTLNLGGFFDDEIANLLKIDIEEEVPLYAMAIGVPKQKMAV